MARRIIEALVDDIDGSQGDETVSFAVDGRVYDIDLSAANAARLRAALAPWAEKARKTGRVSSGGGRKRAASGGEQLAAVRAWAAENGHQVSNRGRISADVMAAYRAAQDAPRVPPPARSKPDTSAVAEPERKRGAKEGKKSAEVGA
ncbi:Lsr2 family protein [Nocardia sp. NPDC057440]|uniref:histone-like nucleoid-structuring protein Lsr2 n=1 Tax=Nocardia sp. NPDC057440 TaxID=3346134 RepID=UPI003672F6FF